MQRITIEIAEEDYATLAGTPKGALYHISEAVRKQARHVRKQNPSPLEKVERLAASKFLARWCDVYREVKGETYVVKKQDATTAKELLDKPKEELRKRLVERYLKHNEWYAKIGHPLYKFDWNAHSDESWANRSKIVPLPQQPKRVSALAIANAK